jgi:hypothetical protein
MRIKTRGHLGTCVGCERRAVLRGTASEREVGEARCLDGVREVVGTGGVVLVVAQV